MLSKRRTFIKNSFLGAAGTLLSAYSCQDQQHKEALAGPPSIDYSTLDAALAKPVLDTTGLNDPVLIESLQLLRYKNNFLCRVRSRDGAIGLSVANNAQMRSLYPIFLDRLQNFFIGQDARQLEALIEEVYVYRSNYKLQNLALWVPLATIEFAILDLLGQIGNRSMGTLLGGVKNSSISVYQANNYRGESATASIEKIKATVADTQAKAVKFKIGGRMSKNKDYPPGRTEELIPLVREAFGQEMTIYADSNGSYDVQESIRIGSILEEYQIDFYEEPTPFDWYEETKAVADALSIPIAGGEQEPSMRNFRWLIGNDALDIVQPDIFYFGGMIRSMRVARMAATKGKSCVPHISGSGLGYLYMMHFVSALPNAGPYHEFKGFNTNIPLECPTADLVSKEGVIKVPTGPGAGIAIDPDFIAKHVVVK
ncbi:MAG: mandelate racemase/muconate lactonizing enzyme family protein [Saprospiraceae bacterium]|nr:mandelate racemase/muconate lactonizing enzyme family protein [Saprospiraceae bacterium]